MSQYFMFEGKLMGELAVNLKTDIVAKGVDLARLHSLPFPIRVTDGEYDLMKAGIDLYDALLDIVEAVKREEEISSDMMENAIAALKKADVIEGALEGLE